MATTLNAVVTEELARVAQAWRDAPHGRKGEILQEAARRLQMSRATIHRHLGSVCMTKPRKRRCDAGKTALTLDDARMISSLLLGRMRETGKRLGSMETALRVLRTNGEIQATRTDPATGEVVPLSDSAILRALSVYNLHPHQLLAPAPAVSLRSLHPNHLWQIDASRCVLYYLPRGAKDNGLRIMREAEFNKNKPANLVRAISDALWRYVITDHTSGWLFVLYVLGGETTQNLADAVITCMTQQEGRTMHGVPKIWMLDPGSPNKSAPFRNLAHALGVEIIINKRGNPRAKGQVENGQDIVENGLEADLRLFPLDQVDEIEKINVLARRWMRVFNGTSIHTRTDRTRDAVWQHIKPEELVFAPPRAAMEAAAMSKPEYRVVNTFLRVSFNGAFYNVAHVPGVNVGQKVLVCTNLWRDDAVHVVGVDKAGREIYHVAPKVLYDEFNMPLDAPVVGERHARHADTPAQANLKKLEMLAMDASTLTEAEAKRKGRYVPYGGRIDPFKHIDEAQVPAAMPRRGRDHDLAAPAVQLPPLSHIQAAKQLKQLFADWSPDYYACLQALYPDGVPADAIDAAAQALRAAMAPAPTQSPIVQIVRAA
ncbi:integrase [Achromobacter xylosoxidans]|uniref:integrase n=1 Tax=Alcaligenes xylosoxydans xylosoxydans TaxID=85698 RepID=UPI001F0E4B89|nr:integrase [Achromobacter xylosoxidans]MCH4576610.1 integrase [Achromobacter xylosoxidans]